MASQGRSRRTYTWSMSKKKTGASRTPVSKEIQIVSATNGAGLSRETTFKLVPDTTAPTVTVQSADVAVGRIVVKAEDNTPGAGIASAEVNSCAGKTCTWGWAAPIVWGLMMT